MRHHDETSNEEQQRFEENKGGSELMSPTQQARIMGKPFSDRGMVLDQTQATHQFEVAQEFAP